MRATFAAERGGVEEQLDAVAVAVDPHGQDANGVFRGVRGGVDGVAVVDSGQQENFR
jgi:hypothetical protein